MSSGGCAVVVEAKSRIRGGGGHRNDGRDAVWQDGKALNATHASEGELEKSR